MDGIVVFPPHTEVRLENEAGLGVLKEGAGGAVLYTFQKAFTPCSSSLNPGAEAGGFSFGVHLPFQGAAGGPQNHRFPV